MSDIQPVPALPPGVSLASWRETSQIGANGQVQQGLALTVRLPDSGTTTVFVPNQLLHDTNAVQAAISRRVGNIQAIQALFPG